MLNANVLKTSWEFTRYAKMIYGPLSIFTIFVPFYVSNQINLFADSNNLSWRCMFRLMELKLDPLTITWFLWRWFSLIKAFIDKFLDFDTDIRMAFFSLFRTCIIHNGDACIVYTKRSIFWWKNLGRFDVVVYQQIQPNKSLSIKQAFSLWLRIRMETSDAQIPLQLFCLFIWERLAILSTTFKSKPNQSKAV